MIFPCYLIIFWHFYPFLADNWLIRNTVVTSICWQMSGGLCVVSFAPVLDQHSPDDDTVSGNNQLLNTQLVGAINDQIKTTTNRQQVAYSCHLLIKPTVVLLSCVGLTAILRVTSIVDWGHSHIVDALLMCYDCSITTATVHKLHVKWFTCNFPLLSVHSQASRSSLLDVAKFSDLRSETLNLNINVIYMSSRQSQ